jgi:hypothetical protein
VPILASGVIALAEAAEAQDWRVHAGDWVAGIFALLALIAFGHVLSGWAHGQAVRET